MHFIEKCSSNKKIPELKIDDDESLLRNLETPKEIKI